MFTPDIRILFLILLLVNVVLALLLFIFWKTQKTYYGFFLSGCPLWCSLLLGTCCTSPWDPFLPSGRSGTW